MKHFLRNFLLATVPTLVVLFLVLEVVFRFVIVAPDPPRQCMDLANNVMRFDTTSKRSGVFTVGRFGQQRGRWHINNYGWLSTIDYRPKSERTKPLIAVVGDSYVEALQVDDDKSFVALLRQALADSFDVYGFGFSGAPLSGYLHLVRYVDRVFDPDIIVVNLVQNDFDESVRELVPDPEFLQVSVRGDSVVEVPPVPRHYNELKRFLFHSAVMRYVYYVSPNFFHRFNWNRPKTQDFAENVETDRLNRNRAVIEKATRYLMGRIVAENRGRRVYFIMAAPRGDIYNGTLDSSVIRWMNTMVADIASGLPCTLIDQTDYFKRDYETNRRRFESPYDAHWNDYGHLVAYRQLLDALRKREG
jgi:hypothetical protein